MEKQKVNIEITSDFICPWCYIGIFRMDRIKEILKKEIDMIIQVKPYMLYPGIPANGSPKEVFAKKTKSGMGKALKEEASKEKINIDYKKIQRIPNSLQAHRIVSLTENKEKEWSLTKAIFKSYFQDGLDIGDQGLLAEIANNNDIDLKTIDSFLNTDKGKQNVDNQISEAMEKFITVVPSVHFDGKLIVPGLQDEAIWKKYIKKAALLRQS